MAGFKFVVFTLILCGFHFYRVQCQNCIIESNTSGKIVGGGRIKSYEKCWIIPVPLGYFIHLQLLAMTSELVCNIDSISIEISGISDTQKYCSSDSHRNPITAVGNVTVTHSVTYYADYFTSFALEYTIAPIECIYGNSFKCDSNSCIPKEKVCNGVKDCKNGADESGCETIDCMNNNTFKCNENSCISMEKVCDGVKHCENGADEIGCDTLQSLCKQESQGSGEIVVAGNFQRSQECWTIPVKFGEFIYLKFTYLLSKHSCANDYVEIRVSGKSDVYKFCDSNNFKNPVAAFGNVTVIHNVSAQRSDYSSFRLEYTTIPLEEIDYCLDVDSFRCDNSSCVPKEKVCDGVEDCVDGADENECETTKIVPIEGVGEAKERAISWLKKKRTPAWGWKENTPRAVVALYLASAATFNGTILEEELMAKQNELMTLVALQRPNVTNSELSMLINALLVTCHNPRQFYGKNLVKRLKDQVEESGNFIHPVAYLALCNANESWPLRAASDLDSILNSSSQYPFVKDLQAMAVMSILCATDHRRILPSVKTQRLLVERVQHFTKQQVHDGSFGNAYTTALITQALLKASQDDWKLNEAIRYLMKELNSSSVDFLTTYFSLPVLNGKRLMDIANVNCSANPRKHGDDPVEDISDHVGQKMRVQYSLHIGDEKDVVHTISLRVPQNHTASEVMKMAAIEDTKYKFKSKTTSGKMYVYEIANVANDPEAGKFWLLFVGAAKSSGSLTHLTKGPDEIILRDGDHLVLWYKTVTI